MVRAHEALLGHGAGAVRLRRDVALKQITWENLELRDPRFIKEIHRWFAQKAKARASTSTSRTRRCRCLRPSWRLRDMAIDNRVVVSPMDQYSAVDGVPAAGISCISAAARSAARAWSIWK